MLKIKVEASDFTETGKNGEIVFVKYGPFYLQLEHSLVSISKWESKWKKPFLIKNEKSEDELYDYIKLMTITQNVPDIAFQMLGRSEENINAIQDYIGDPMTATTFADDNKSSVNREIITSELVYYWMIANQIPMECQKWHINRLLTLIRVCGIKNSPPKKMSRAEVYRRNTSVNAARRAKINSKG